MASTGTHIETTLPPAGAAEAQDAASQDAAKQLAEMQTGRLLTVTAGHAVNDQYQSYLPALLPALIEALSLSKTEAGALMVFQQGPSLLQPVIGYLADRTSLRYLVILAPAISGVAMSLLGVVPNYALLLPLLLVAGLSSAGLHAVGSGWTGSLAGRRLGRGMSFWMVGGEMGYGLGALAVSAVVGLWGLRGTPVLMVTGFIASAFLYARLRHLAPRASLAGRPRPWRQALGTMRPLLVPVAAIVLLRGFLDACLGTFMPTFVREQGASIFLAGMSLSLIEVAAVGGTLVAGALSDRLGRRRVLGVSLFFTPLLMFLFLNVAGVAQFGVLMAQAFAAYAGTPVLMAMMQESLPENRTMASGIFLALNFAARSLIVVLVGALADRLGLRQAFFISAALALLSLPLVFALPGPRSGLLRRGTA